MQGKGRRVCARCCVCVSVCLAASAPLLALGFRSLHSLSLPLSLSLNINGQAQGGPNSFTKGKTNMFSIQGLSNYSGDIFVGQAQDTPDFEMILKQNEMR